MKNFLFFLCSLSLVACRDFNPETNQATDYSWVNQSPAIVTSVEYIENPTIKNVSEAVIAIRESKLPNPKVLGNAGSFFKNPEIPTEEYLSLKEKFPAIVGYKTSENNTKLAAGWLIEQCGWKGKVVGKTGSHKDQALVLVNYGNATGNEIWKLAMQIQESVFEKFGVTIIPEVNVI
jgi:UDP-N-acetylmuramate dehydrogenase